MTTAQHPLHRHPLRSLFTYIGARSRRASSWDRRGGNRDFFVVRPGETVTLLEHDGPGCITHLYCALAFYEEARTAFFTAVRAALTTLPSPEVYRIARIGELFYRGTADELLARQIRTIQVFMGTVVQRWAHVLGWCEKLSGAQ